MAIQHYLEFDTFDNPMHLSKVGNWVFTFISPKEELEKIELAMTNVIPRHLSEMLQPRRIIIAKTEHAQRWLIKEIECYDSTQLREVSIQADDTFAQTALHGILQEFAKYDVNVAFI